MRQGLFSLLLVLMIVSCAQRKTSVFLKTQELALSQPKVQANSSIIDSFVVLNASLRMDGIKLLYTKDETEPNQKSLLYSKPLKITKEGVYKFKAFHKDWKPSATVVTSLYQKGYKPDSIDWITKANEKYNDLGEQALINNRKGALDFMDKQWLGFDTVAKASLIFKETTFIKKITIGYLVDTKSWIFPPESISVCINDNERFDVLVPPYVSPNSKMLGDATIFINKEVKKVEIVVNNRKKIPEWHPGKGLEAWLFMDEWIFNE